MNVVATRTYDPNQIKAVLLQPEIWDTVAEDGRDPTKFEPEVNGEGWLLMQVGDDVIGVYNLHAHNAVTLEIHAHVLPHYRKQYSQATGLAALRWIHDNATSYHKIIAQVPKLYENVKEFTCGFGFQVEGVNRLSYRKGGKLYDQWLLGMTKDELIKAISHE